jgi:hypothetical protein
MTADEQEAQDILDAQEAKDIADAQAAKAAGKAPVAFSPDEIANDTSGADTSDPYGVGALKSFAKGAGRGLASLPEPSDVVTAISNIPKRLKNDYQAKINPAVAGPEGWSSPPPLPVELNTNPYSLHIADNYNRDVPADPNHPWAEAIGQTAGPIAVEAALTGGASLAAAPEQITASTLARTALKSAGGAAVTTGGTMAGGKTGELADQALGGGGEVGNLVGSVVGGGLPGVVTQAGWKGFSKALTEEDSLARYNEAVRAGVDPSLPLVGSKRAGQWEDATLNWPLGGGPALRSRLNQHGQIDTAAREVAADLRGEPNAGNINDASMGDKLRAAAETADRNAKAAQDARLNPLAEQTGRDLPIDQTTQLEQMDLIRRGSQPRNRGAVQNAIDNTNSSRFDPENPPKIVDPALEAQLQMKVNQAKRRLQGANSAENAKAAQDELDSLQTQQAANRGQTYQEVSDDRSDIGRRIEGQVPLTARQTISTKKTLTDSMKNAAALAGVSPEEFDAAYRDYGFIAGQRRKGIQPLLEKNTPGQGEAYTKMFGGTSRSNIDRIKAFDTFAPDETRNVMADELERRLRGVNAGGPPNPEGVGPTIKSAPDWWQKAPDATKEIMGGPAGEFDQSRLAALLKTMEADARRTNRSAPGKSGNTSASGSRAFFSSALLGTPNFAANLTGRALTNPNFTRRVIAARNQSYLRNLSLARILASAAGRPSVSYPNSYPDDEEGAR